jgi:hypothetical protein
VSWPPQADATQSALNLQPPREERVQVITQDPRFISFRFRASTQLFLPPIHPSIPSQVWYGRYLDERQLELHPLRQGTATELCHHFGLSTLPRHRQDGLSYFLSANIRITYWHGSLMPKSAVVLYFMAFLSVIQKASHREICAKAIRPRSARSVRLARSVKSVRSVRLVRLATSVRLLLMRSRSLIWLLCQDMVCFDKQRCVILFYS